jgi:hypothetical protein
MNRSIVEQKAGLFHSIYGTEYYINSKKLNIQRDEIIKLIGNESENLVYTFCSLSNRTQTILSSDLKNNFNLQLRWVEYANLIEQNKNHPFIEKFENDLGIKKEKIVNYTPELSVAAIFSTPIGFINLGEQIRPLNKNLINDLENEMIHNKNCQRTFSGNLASWQSQLGLEIKYESFKNLQKIVTNVSIEFLKSIFLEKKFLNNVHVDNFWGNIIYGSGGWSQPHIHGDGVTFLSGVYYPKSDGSENLNLDNFDASKFLINATIIQEEGVLVLRDPAKIIKGLSRSRYFYNKSYYGGNMYIRPREGALLLFPASLEHFVTPLINFREKRYSISFAVSIKQ